jgi:hypothetical protein
MFGHVAGRQRRSRWAILSFLFALAFAWSFAVMGERSGLWSILRLGLAVGLGISLLRLVLTLVSSRSLRRGQEDEGRRAEDDEGAEMEAEGQPPAEEPPTEKHALTYEEVFQVKPNIDLGSLAPAPEDEEWQAEAEEGADMEAEGQPPAEEPPTEDRAPTSEEDLQVLQPDPDGAVDQVEAPEADAESQDSLQRMREEFAARAKEAELRVKQREAELDEAASAPKSKP